MGGGGGGGLYDAKIKILSSCLVLQSVSNLHASREGERESA